MRGPARPSARSARNAPLPRPPAWWLQVVASFFPFPRSRHHPRLPAEAPDGVIFSFAADDTPVGAEPGLLPLPPSEAQTEALGLVAAAAADSANAWAAAVEAAVANGPAPLALTDAQRQPLDKALSAVSRLEALLGSTTPVPRSPPPVPLAAAMARAPPGAPRLAPVEAAARGKDGTLVIRARSKLEDITRSATPLLLALAAAEAFFAALKPAAAVERDRVAAAARAAAAQKRADAAAAKPREPVPVTRAQRGSASSAAFLGLAIAMTASVLSSKTFQGGFTAFFANGAAMMKATVDAAQRNASANAEKEGANAQTQQTQQAQQTQAVAVKVSADSGSTSA